VAAAVAAARLTAAMDAAQEISATGTRDAGNLGRGARPARVSFDRQQ